MVTLTVPEAAGRAPGRGRSSIRVHRASGPGPEKSQLGKVPARVPALAAGGRSARDDPDSPPGGCAGPPCRDRDVPRLAGAPLPG